MDSRLGTDNVEALLPLPVSVVKEVIVNTILCAYSDSNTGKRKVIEMPQPDGMRQAS